MTKQTKRLYALSAIALAAAVVACSDKGQQVLGAAMPAAPAEAQASAPKGPAKPLPKGVYRMQLMQIPDPSGRMNTPVAARVLVPAGWTAEGGVIWPQAAVQECAEYATFAWAATSPDGMSSFELFPTELWNASNGQQMPCMPGEFQDVRSYLTAFAQAHVPGASNFQYRERPELLEPQREDIEFKMRIRNDPSQGSRFWPDAGELTFTYNDNGTQMKGVLGATGRFYMNQAANPFGGPPSVVFNGQTITTYAASFPAASFDPQLVEMMRKSLKSDLVWAFHYSDFITEIGWQKTGVVKQRSKDIVIDGARLTRATLERNAAAGNAAVAKAYADSPITSGGTDDRSQRERIEAIRGVETYDDPVYGGTVQLDNTYDHAWRVQNNDSYIMTNDPNFNPGQYNIDAKQLQVSR